MTRKAESRILLVAGAGTRIDHAAVQKSKRQKGNKHALALRPIERLPSITADLTDAEATAAGRQLFPLPDKRRLHHNISRFPPGVETDAGNPYLDRHSSTDVARIDHSNAITICFGSFRLLPAQRLLLEGDQPLRLGSRALEILIALVERSGELVGKEELMARVWPNTCVEPANLTIQIAALRRTLRDGRGGNRFLINIPGRGYRFVAPIRVSSELAAFPPEPVAAEHAQNLPVPVTRLIGRESVVAELAAQLSRDRFLTIVGPGGIGKTFVALTVAEKLIGAHEHGVWLVDLASLTDPALVPSALAATLGLEIDSEDPLAELVAALRDKHMLLVLDNCEHVIGSAAKLIASVLSSAPKVHILATSREPLNTYGEHLYRLLPLGLPAVSLHVNAREALGSPAVQLFVEQAASTLGEFELSDGDAPHVANICRRLDGLALAIEIAAARVAAFGVLGVAKKLQNGLQVLTSDRRTALPRHQSMGASLDWSHALLSEAEQKVFRRLAILAGEFTLRAAAAVAADEIHGESKIFDLVAALAAKSLVASDACATEPRFRLLETTRAYALAKLAGSDDVNMLGRRYAEYFDLHSETAPNRRPAVDDRLGSSLRIQARKNGSIKRHSRASGTMIASLR
jgi:predicted ATPase/DNA-binding winged helix-turn-helix (wHTH) protein